MHIRRRLELGLANKRQTQRGRKAILLLEWLEERCTPSGAPFMGPPIIQSVNGILSTTLTEAVGPAVVGDTQVQNAWVYNGSYPGPALVANPGDSLDIKIVNALDEPTNLHTHGLHVSPIGNSDNVLLQIEPGESNPYHIEIPADHPQGLYWYHPHHHGFVNDQISRGMSGLLVVGRPDGGAPELDGLHQYLMGLDNALLQGDQIVVPALDGSDHNLQTFTINGQLNPVLTMQPGEWAVFNIANIGNNGFYKANLFDSATNKAVNLLQVAVDGNPFTTMLSDLDLGLGFPTGRRWSFLIHAPATPSPGQTFQFNSLGFASQSKPVDPTNQWPAAPLFTIQFAGVPWVPPQGFVTPVDKGPLSPPNNFFKDLRNVPASEIAAFRTVQFGEDGEMELINGNQFPNNPIFQPRLNTVEEWTLINPTAADHPFHLHVDPQQVAQGGPFNLTGLDRYEDVILVPPRATITIRIEFEDYLGTTVYHCHRVDHEDMGMMALVKMIPTIRSTRSALMPATLRS